MFVGFVVLSFLVGGFCVFCLTLRLGAILLALGFRILGFSILMCFSSCLLDLRPMNGYFLSEGFGTKPYASQAKS